RPRRARRAPGELAALWGRSPRPLGEDRSRSLSRRDLGPILALTLVYALTAFFRLGSTVEPQTFAPMAGRQAEIRIPEGARVSQIWLYSGVGMGRYALQCSPDGEGFEYLCSFEQDHIAVLKWTPLESAGPDGTRFLRITCLSGEPWLGEIVLLDGDGLPLPVTSDVPALCDEPEKAHLERSFLTSSYFDEIYHARTAWEHLHGVWPYEVTHPPLGKEIIGLGVALFGMTPFGWRFSGTFFGVLMLPLMYVFLKKLFGGRAVPAMGTALLATDFMHYVQTRIATIDTYAVFFILLMYLLMYLWLTEDRLWALGACGVAFGLGAASKWTSLYAGAGLAVLWAAKWIWRFWKVRKAGRTPAATGASPAVPASPASPDPGALTPLGRAFWRNVCFCLVFFVAVPGLIYALSYIPYARAAGTPVLSLGYVKLLWQQQIGMYTYHAKSVLGSTHPYSSRWTQWLLDLRPILYVLEYPSDSTKISIAAWLSPVLCWGGLMALPVLGYAAVARRDRRAAFILLGYLAQLLPWVGIERLTFAYHYFPSSVFLVLALSYVLCLLRENVPRWRGWAWALVGGSAALFVLFFPALNGLEISRELGSALMRWLPGWPL
ncbi:MAG: glycosyltransferase family 39 protein, partial [Oscillospiraceae bacterium]|nr:glycosyltransferase family 39 protein [Oscillospiraceae bacterium]